jgi:hypothetical protein
MLIILGTMILPWLAAWPIFKAGYNLEDYSPHSVEGKDTLRAAIFTVIPFLMVWHRWDWHGTGTPQLASAAIFCAILFLLPSAAMNGLITGVIGSLGCRFGATGVRREAAAVLLRGWLPYEYLYARRDVPVRRTQAVEVAQRARGGRSPGADRGARDRVPGRRVDADLAGRANAARGGALRGYTATRRMGCR